jgi:N-acetylglucosamine malate deacetylase 1
VTVLVVVAHPDDEVLGCGGTIARFAKEGRQVHVLQLADGESSRSSGAALKVGELFENRISAAQRACEIMGCASLECIGLPDNRLDSLELLDLVKIIEKHIDQYKPVTVFTHHSGDVNIDHRIVHEAVLAACRPLPGHSVRELIFFEIPSSTEWRPSASGLPYMPNMFVDISDTLPIKLQAMEAYASELRLFPHPRSLKAITALAQWRGATVGVEAAEAFISGRKLVA